MFFPRWQIHENVVKEDQDEFPEMMTKKVIHEALEGYRGIGEAERHYNELVMAFMSLKSCFQYIIFVYLNLMVVST